MTATLEKLKASEALNKLVCYTLPMHKVPVGVILLELAFVHDIHITPEELGDYLFGDSDTVSLQ